MRGIGNTLKEVGGQRERRGGWVASEDFKEGGGCPLRDRAGSWFSLDSSRLPVLKS